MTSSTMAPALQPPRFLFVDVNQRCNLRCQHCMYWKTEQRDPSDLISIERRNDIVREFAAMNAAGKVVICGGESLLDPERYFAVAATCGELGLGCLSVINGTKINTSEMADRMVTQGPGEVTVSLNSHLAEIHDASRGVPGSFALAVKALRLLLEARSRRRTATKLFVMAVICELNYRDLDPFYDFVLNNLGADKLKLNFLQPTFGPPTPWYQDRFFSENVVRDEEALARIILACDAKYGLRINPAWLEEVKMYHRSIRNNGWKRLGWRRGAGTEAHICNSYDRNIMVDLRGRARLCFYPGFPAFQLARTGDLRRFWEGCEPLRRRMRRCNRYCAISHSVRNQPATSR
jgi:MoaA/NifB/PqqE/SkfB family radical SAM enzyme